MNIRAVIFERMRSRELTTADLLRLLGGRVKERTVYDFLTGFNAYVKAVQEWKRVQPEWERKPPLEPKVGNWEVKSVSDELRRQIYAEHERRHAAWKESVMWYDAAFAEHKQAIRAWSDSRPTPKAFFDKPAPMGSENLNHLLDVLELQIIPAEDVPPTHDNAQS